MNQSDRKSQQKKQCLNSIIYISVVILFFQGISNTLIAIVGQFAYQNGQGWVGPVSTALLFLGSGSASHYNKYIDKMPYKYSFFIGSLGYTLFIGLSVIFLKTGFTTLVQILILVGSLISGITVSMFYNSQFNYVNACSEIDRQKTKYFGINMCIVQSCNILSNLMSAFLIESVGQFTYSVIMDSFCFSISLFFLCVKNYSYSQGHQALLNEKKEYYITHQQKNKYCQNPITPSQPEMDQKVLFDPIKLKPQKIPYRIILSFCFSGVILSFIYGQLSIVFYDTFQNYYLKQELNRITFIAFIIEGVGQFFGGFAVVFAQEIITKRFSLPITYVGVTLLFLVSEVLIYIASSIESLSLMYACCLIVGFTNCMSFTLGLSISGQWKQQGITYFTSAQSLTVAVSLIMIAFIKFDYIIIYAIVMFFLSSYGVLTYEKSMDVKNEKSIAHQPIISK